MSLADSAVSTFLTLFVIPSVWSVIGGRAGVCVVLILCECYKRRSMRFEDSEWMSEVQAVNSDALAAVSQQRFKPDRQDNRH